MARWTHQRDWIASQYITTRQMQREWLIITEVVSTPMAQDNTKGDEIDQGDELGEPREADEVEEHDDFRCTICGETFETQQELEEHGEEAHEEDREYDKQP